MAVSWERGRLARWVVTHERRAAMLLLIATAAAIFGLPILGILTGFAQLGWYRFRKTPADDIPFFGFLVLRGMIEGLAIIAVCAIISHLPAAK